MDGMHDIMMQDLTPEEMEQGMDRATRYVAKTFLDKEHYRSIHSSLSRSWDRLHSLSAAIKLMESYGASLEPEEEEGMASMSEAEQINFLVSKLPQHQGADSFHEFFLKLQLLVSTAMRVRRNLEEGKPDEVAAALDDADTTGIAPYILKVAIVQAGGEVAQLKLQFEAWMAEADNKMARLLRGQQDNMTAQTKLAEAKAELARQNGEQNAKTAKAVLSFASGNDKVLLKAIFGGWAQVTKQERMEAQLRLEYGDRLTELENKLTRWKAGQLERTSNVILRKIKEDQLALFGRIFDIWVKEVEEGKFMRENGDKVRALEARLQQSQDSQKQNATKVLGGLAASSERGLLDISFKAFVSCWEEAVKAKERQQARMHAESKLDQFTSGKSEEAKFLVQSFANVSDSGLSQACFAAWVQLHDEAKKEAELCEVLNKSTQKLDGLKGRSKASSGSVMNRASHHISQLILIRTMTAWRLDAKVSRITKVHSAKIEAKRQQLIGVQHMFRNFAEKLEKGIGNKEGKDSSRLFERAVEGGRRMSKTNPGSVSLPTISGKSGSGRSSHKTPPSQQPGKVVA